MRNTARFNKLYGSFCVAGNDEPDDTSNYARRHVLESTSRIFIASLNDPRLMALPPFPRGASHLPKLRNDTFDDFAKLLTEEFFFKLTDFSLSSTSLTRQLLGQHKSFVYVPWLVPVGYG
ncbi:hypothetical protein ARMSODRAFT_1071332 [Armillaria solidipes]|uniref:Uncharacterized protein n=1 Tax=Armillaria solidipes TaxID=1076256 RepID=A0A2H3B716_9AGAR|nr:hypothetical protein ARMSODRAFT_1071332 [Armillaria solidipes]